MYRTGIPGERPPRSRMWLALLLGAVLVVIATLSVVVSLGGDEEAVPQTVVAEKEPESETPVLGDPLPVAQEFLAAWAVTGWQDVARLAAGDDAATALSDWWIDLEVESATFDVGDVRTQDAVADVDFTAEVTIRATTPRWTFSSTLHLVAIGGVWNVEWAPSVAHSDLRVDEHLELRRTLQDRAPITTAEGLPLVANFADVVVGVIPGNIESVSRVRRGLVEIAGASGPAVDRLLGRTDLRSDWFYPITTVPRTEYPIVRPALFPIPGVAFRLTERRAPLESPFAGHILGRTGEVTAELLQELEFPYTANSIVGRSGLERIYERELAGEPTVDIVRVSEDGTVLGSVATLRGRAAKPLATTLSLDVQRAAEAAMAEVEGPSAMVVIDTGTGQVRAAVSRPLDEFDRALSGLYAPGSTFKIIVAAALLESGLTLDTSVSCPSVATVSGRDFHNAATLATSMTFEQAFVRSCNTAFIELARGLDPGVIAETAARFGFDLSYEAGIPIAGASYPPPQSDSEAAASAIGQARVLASPLHMASVAAAVASGSWRSPTIVAGLPFEIRQLDREVAEGLRTMMRGVVEAGTGRNASVEGIEVSGKTGTAQVGEGDDVATTAWFVGFAEGLAFAVVVEGGESGGKTAAPIAAAFLTALATAEPAADLCADPTAGWPTFQGTNARTGCSSVRDITEPRIRWAVDVGIQAWLNSPIVVDGMVIVGTAGNTRTIPDESDGLVAVDLASGKERWRFATGNDVNGVASDGTVVIATGDEGAVWALQVTTGDLVWVVTSDAAVFTHPLIVGDLVVVGDVRGELRALSLADGSLRWSATLDGPIRGGASSDGTLVFAAGERGEVAAFTLEGFKVWDTQLEPAGETIIGSTVRVLGAPTVLGDLVIVSVIIEGGIAGPGIQALDKYVGTVRWRGSDPASVGDGWESVRTSVAVSGSALLFGSSFATGLQAVDAANGAATWASSEGVVCDIQFSSPIVVGDVAYVARSEGSLLALDASSGSELWQVALTVPEERSLGAGCAITSALAPGAEVQATPAVAPDGTIVVGSLSGILYAIGQG